MIASWWFPSTDGGVGAQMIGTLLLGAALGALARKETPQVLLVIGVTLVALGVGTGAVGCTRRTRAER